ncbi:MAG TPA: hypothetical protein VNN07_11700 [Candidatus Tectomicrobia bacterium]|nr:hypothetical protein [Candidatus Tectomicrobia bacterium]
MPLFLYSGNVHLVVADETYGAFAAVTGLAAVLVAVAYLQTRNAAKTVALACGVLAWLYWSSAFVRGLGLVLDASTATAVGLTLWTAGAAAYVVLVLRARPRHQLVRVWVIVSLTILALPVFMFTRFLLFHRGHSPRTIPAAVDLKAPGQPPDIYYVIFDRYAGQETLRHTYGFDNSEIIAYLRGRGFYVADRSHANYLRTGPSLASSLNFEHLPDLYAGMQAVSDWRPIYDLLQEHRVWRSLRPLGYEFVNIGSWWQPTRHNPHATENHAFAPLPAFFHTTYEATTLYAMGITFKGRMDPRRVQWQQVPQQVEAIARAGRRERPRFVFAHLLLPHDPYVFGPDGRFLPEEVVAQRTLAENYLNQVRFANAVITRLVDVLLATPPRRQPVIIIQADEGPFPKRDDPAAVMRLASDWRKASPDDLRQKFGILNALYVPGAPAGAFYPAMTPVNTFRIVLNAHFGAQLPMLPDVSFAASSDTTPFDFFEVTTVLAR